MSNLSQLNLWLSSLRSYLFVYFRQTFTPVHLINVHLAAGSSESFSFPATNNTGMVIISGTVAVNNEQAESNEFVLMQNDGDTFTITANEDAIVLLLSGAPINEPIAAHGPFVMNTQQEIVQAFNDFRMGKFGTLD